MIHWDMAVVWLLVVVVALAIEIVTLGLTSIWFAIGAVAATLAALFRAPLWAQNTVFVAVSLLLLIFTRPIAVKYFNKVGRQAIVISEIDNLYGAGQITVNGQEWSARSAEDNRKIPVGTVVEIVAISGVKLIVKEKREEN